MRRGPGARHNGPVSEPIPVVRDVDHGTARLLPDVDRARAWLLTVDGAPQSYVDLDDPAHLEFEYLRRVAHTVDAAAGRPGEEIEVLHLGGGALTLPRYLAATRPGSRQLVCEADAGLLALVDTHLPLAPGDGVRVRAADARAALAGIPAGSQDAVVADVFSGSRIPAHLTTVEYVRAAARVLREDGVYVANLADAAPFGFLRGQLATVAAVLPELALLAEPAVLRGRRYGNAVLAASRTPLPLAELARRVAADPFPARVVYGSRLDRLVRGAAPVQDGAEARSPLPPGGSFTVG